MYKPSRLKLETGMSFIEVMIATVLIVIVLTALVVTIGATGVLNLNSKATQIGTTLIHDRLEYLRNLDFDKIGYTDAQSGEPSGIIQRTETTQIASIQFTIDYDISWVDLSETSDTALDYKKIKIKVSWNNPSPGSVESATIISQASRRSPGKIIKPPAPEIITPPTPSPNSIISGTIGIQIEEDTTSYSFSDLEIRIGGGLAGNKKSFQPPQTSCMMTYNWDTTGFEDGKYGVEALAYEVRGGTSSRSWYYFVNNSAPTETPVLEVKTGTITKDSATLEWTLIKDGNETIEKYILVQSYPEVREITVVPDPDDPTVNFTETKASKILQSLLPWTTYTYSCKGESHGDYSPLSNIVEFTTKINLSAGTSKDKNYYKVDLSWTPAPNPEALIAIDVYRDGNKVASLNPSVSTWSDPHNYSKWDKPNYQVKAKDSDGVYINESNVVTVSFK